MRGSRITNTQRAAVCALILAGVGFIKSCRIVGAPERAMKAALGDDGETWWGRSGSRPAKWRGDKLAEIKSAYLDRSIPLSVIEITHGIKRRHVTSLARREGWPRRPRGKGPALPIPLAKMSDRQRNSYTKLSRVLGRDAALQAVLG